ncbi:MULTISPECIES: sensor domain-containing protein [unclassified Halorubrum]|uniref:sensor domain-containing protein n=1 Tax=unclassified Halorubrum TaxID=2642239 RepID=UPI0010F813C9|nr:MULTISPECIES: sensor domain-containing protein [unclassified Halorubrum]TKX45695.1 histidine kinase [Halorubrum sp. ARQ200]TKX51228.1 histidine kinase [Halorubrum sp. ASP121]
MVFLRPLAALPVVGVVADGRTYRRLLYLLIAVPLWVVYSGFVTFALAFGLVFSVVLVGVGVLIGAVVASRIAAGLERWLANSLLGTDLVAPDDLQAPATDGSAGAVATVGAYLSAPSTWRGLGFVSLKFWVTVLALAPLAVLARSLALVGAPVRYPYAPQFGEVNGEPAVWAIDTAPEAALATGVGVVGLLVGLHLTNLIAGGARLMAVALLGESDESDGGDDGDRVTVERDGDREVADDPDGSDDRGADSDGEPDADGFQFDADPADPDPDPDDRG